MRINRLGHATVIFGVGFLAAGPVETASADGYVTYVRYSSSGCRPVPPAGYGYPGGYSYVRTYAAPTYYVAAPTYYVAAPAVTYRSYSGPYTTCATPSVGSYTYRVPSRSSGSYGYSRGYDSRGGSYGYRSGYSVRSGSGYPAGYGYRSGYSSGRSYSYGTSGSRCGTSAGVSLRYYGR